MKGHKFSLKIYSFLKMEERKIFSKVNLEEKISIPEIYNMLCPTADIFLDINGDKISIIEVDDDNDCSRSVIKYWPLLYNYKKSEIRNKKLVFFEIFRRGSTYGLGYKVLAEFIGQRFNEYYSDFFKFYFIDAYNLDAENIANKIIGLFKY